MSGAAGNAAYAELARSGLLEEGPDLAAGVAADERTLSKAGEGHLSARRVRNAGLVMAGLLAVAGLLALDPVGRASRSVAERTAEGKAELIHDGQEEAVGQCSNTSTNCQETKCCTVPGTRCYEKRAGKKGWAMCRPECTAGPDPTDPDSDFWSCKELGPRKSGRYNPTYWPKPAPWVAKNCSKSSEDCSKTRCCAEAGLACFKKNGDTAKCKPGCTPGPDPADTDSKPWDCKQLGGRTPGNAKPRKITRWAKRKCSNSTENCADAGCCKDEGHQCFQKDSGFAMCKPSCTKGMCLEDPKDWKDWTCKALGGRTPGQLPAPKEQKRAEWVDKHCSDYGENCKDTRCCKGDSSQCYAKNASFASCMYRCDRNGPEGDDGWSCKALGPRTERAWGSPSLFCMHVFRLKSYEAGIIKAQLAMDGRFRGGIFSCDQYALYASDTAEGTFIGDGPLGPVLTRHFEPAPVWTSKDGTAANTQLFMNVWEAVRWDAQYSCCDWTIKADPDAVVLPDRLRYQLKKYTGAKPTFILTCDKGFADGPMMFGALEAISSSALQKYYDREDVCRNMGWQSWGEDLWMGKCLMSLGVPPTLDKGIVGDNLCYGANCGNGYSGAYHPFKSTTAWMQCYKQSTQAAR